MFGSEPVPGSFGSVGVITPASSDRLKGFLTYVVKDDTTAKFTADVVREGMNRLKNGHFSRLSIRIIATAGSMENLAKEIKSKGAEIEAQIPVTSDNSLFMVYIGYNKPSRVLSSERRSEYSQAIDNAVSGADNAQPLKSLDITKYGTKIIDGSTRDFSASDREDIFNLLSTFGYDREGALNIVSDESNIIGMVYDRKTSRIVSISVTERRDIALEGGITLHMAELTDAVTSDTERHNRLYPILLNEVFRHIYNEHSEISLVYAESNVSNISLLNTAAMQHRQIGGMLPLHAYIRNPNTGELERKTLAVTSLTRDGMSKVIDIAEEQELLRK
ncbi:MAG: hypothetical protein ACYCO0_00440 [Candidatus Micrarchaeaceae archaeon]